MTMKFLAVSILLAAGLVLGGCSGGEIQGRVIAGQAGVLKVVALGSGRPEEPGIKGAAIELRAVGRAGNGPTISNAVSGSDGHFTLSYSDRRMVRDRLQLVATAEGYIPVQESFFLPGTGRMVLVVMKQSQTPAPAKPGAKPGE